MGPRAAAALSFFRSRTDALGGQGPSGWPCGSCGFDCWNPSLSGGWRVSGTLSGSAAPSRPLEAPARVSPLWSARGRPAPGMPDETALSSLHTLPQPCPRPPQPPAPAPSRTRSHPPPSAPGVRNGVSLARCRPRVGNSGVWALNGWTRVSPRRARRPGGVSACWPAPRWLCTVVAGGFPLVCRCVLSPALLPGPRPALALLDLSSAPGERGGGRGAQGGACVWPRPVTCPKVLAAQPGSAARKDVLCHAQTPVPGKTGDHICLQGSIFYLCFSPPSHMVSSLLRG